MAATGRNIDFPIYSADGTSFENLVLRKATYESVVMSLSDKITGEVYYKNNRLAVTMHEYVVLDGVKFNLVNPPTIVRDGVLSNGADAKGMTKYSFEFYHPMQMLSNFAFTDIAVTDDEEQYLSQNKTFSWIGYPDDFFAKLNKNLESTQWVVTKSDKFPQDKSETLSEVLSFDNNTIADALSTCYETWGVPFVIDKVTSDDDFDEGKEFKIIFGLPAEEIFASDDDKTLQRPYVFRMGQGVGLKNNSRTPRNNKIITQLSGYGSEDNIPYGYPQIVWEGDPNAQFTIGDSIGVKENVTINGKTYAKAISYPIYKGIVGGEWVNLIKHPFTRTHLMPTIYHETVNNKVNPYADDYNPQEVIIDHYDAIATEEYPYPNEIVENAPSFEIKQFEKIKPELGEAYIVDAQPTDVSTTNVSTITNGSNNFVPTNLMSQADFYAFITELYSAQKDYDDESDWWECRQILHDGREKVASDTAYHATTVGGHEMYVTVYDSYLTAYINVYEYEGTQYVERNESVSQDETEQVVTTYTVSSGWDDTIDENGEYVQSYFTITLPILSFDLYACAAITQEMNIVMRSGACIGCTFPIQCDWDYYKTCFYDSDGNFLPDGEQRDYETFPDSSRQQITVIVQKDTQTFGTLMPNVYQIPVQGDAFVITGISLPESYITNAEERLDHEMKSYMLENNIYYYDYPLKFDEYFLATHNYILNQVKPNTVVRFDFAGETFELYIKQLAIKYGTSVLPEYDITLTDNIDVVINQIGQIADDVAKLSSTFSTMRDGLNKNLWSELAKKLSKTQDDTAYGNIAFAANVGTPTFVGGFLGEGWRIDQNNNLTLDNLTVRQSMRVFELLVQQVKATGGEIIVSPANGKIKAVVEQEGSGTGGFPLTFPVTFPQAQGDMYVCTIDSGENESHSNAYGNMFQRGDLVRCQRWDMELGIIHSYWVSVYDVQGNDIYLPKNQFGEYGTPEVGDELVLMGSVSNPLRQGVISIAATDDGKPRITVLNGINSASLTGCTRLVLGDLNGISDPDFTGDNAISGYGLYSNNVFLKGKLAMSNGTLIEDGFVNITDGLANSGINISNGTITLRSDKTEFKNSENVTISAFTDEGIQAYKVNCLDEEGNTRIRLDKDGLKMYYPNGQIMKEEAMVFDEKIVDGVRVITLKGVETRYYSAEGALLWKLDSTGVLSNNTLNEYWTHFAVHYITQLPEYTEVGGKKMVNGGDYGSIGTKENNSIVSVFHSTVGSEHAQTIDGKSSTGFLALGEISSGVPDACYNGNVAGLTGYYLSNPSSMHDSSDSDYLFYYEFVHYVDGWYVEGERLYFYDDPYSGGKD